MNKNCSLLGVISKYRIEVAYKCFMEVFSDFTLKLIVVGPPYRKVRIWRLMVEEGD